uniref:Uncharacterized protein n=1 Tax=Corethron hystrix TaxID=216773 RepID=A0A7S1G155_9STRA|mmetsp:Transcript_7426/g.16064  ORF Transcript_7426/g.16064 Transcript_7426/m.16064 type:complete len:130 (+) Transcript_7426:763-1152(+)
MHYVICNSVAERCTVYRCVSCSVSWRILTKPHASCFLPFPLADTPEHPPCHTFDSVFEGALSNTWQTFLILPPDHGGFQSLPAACAEERQTLIIVMWVMIVGMEVLRTVPMIDKVVDIASELLKLRKPL